MNTTADEIQLPELSEHTIKRMEKNIMNTIQAEKSRATGRRGWVAGLSVAAAFAVGALVSPLALQAVAGAGSGSTLADGSGAFQPELAPAAVADMPAAGAGAMEMKASERESMLSVADGAATGRDIVRSANLELRVDEIRASAERIEAKVAALGGSVQSLSVGTDQAREPRPVDVATSPSDAPDNYGYLSVRVPADQLDAFLKDLGTLGTVTSSTVSADDQTQWGTELRAQVESGQASLDRLNELMGQATNLSDIITLEQAIADRQAQLEWQQQSLKDLESRVAMSEVWINLTTPPAASEPEPGGFISGIEAGWNGFIASLNAVIIAAGFVVPWLLVIGIPVWIIWWLVKRRRTAREAQAARQDE